MRNTLLLAGLFGALLASPAMAEDQLTVAVAACVVQVRQTVVHGAQFDAYVSRGDIHWIGNEREKFAFFKCLRFKGWVFPLLSG
jgi:hypothetical protein